MVCTRIRRACSAILDGETSEIAPHEISNHLRRCAACRDFAEEARALRCALTARRPAPPDVTARVLAAAREERHALTPTTTVLRLGLVAVAVAQLGLAVPTLLFGSDEGAPIHIAHEVGAWDLALAIAFVFAAWRPLRAVGLLPFAAALSGGLIITAVIDVLNGRAIALTETTHLLELVGTGLLWMLVADHFQSRAALRVA